tara:strand:- start:240 stop:656 length:417 start_codon:yes stop_codon:yes gene_type:complete
MQLDIKINLILHATEDEEKILEGLENIFQIEQKDFQIEQVPGHFNNPILLISSKLKKRDAKKFLKHFCENLNKDDFDDVYENVEEYVTSAGLSLRLSKQEMVSGILRISREDAIKININTPVYVKNETKKIYQELLKI